MRKIISASLIMIMISTHAFSQKDKKESSQKDKKEKEMSQKDKDKEKEMKKNAKDDEKISTKLLNLYAMDKHEQCIEASDKYIKNESTARSPYPYLYTSMCYLSIHNDQDNYDMKKFKDPLRKSLGFMGRFKKKDKGGELQKENGEFLRELRKATLFAASSLNEKKDFKNLQNLARDIAKNYDKDESMLIIGGMYLCRSDAKIEGERSIETGMNLLKKRKDEGNAKFDSDQSDQLAESFVLYTDYLLEIKDVVKSKSVVQFAKDLLPENEKINKRSDKIMKQ